MICCAVSWRDIRAFWHDTYSVRRGERMTISSNTRAVEVVQIEIPIALGAHQVAKSQIDRREK